ncbi:putative membrane protein [Emiliania huxleyi virus 156]|nr:putative membrane protein [Emiliania huxleyi virus 156]
MDTKDFIIIGLSVSLFVAVSVIIYLFSGRQQMNSTIPTNKEIITYYDERNKPFLFHRSFSELGGNDGQEAIGHDICVSELPKG